jgi:hypothetical protein
MKNLISRTKQVISDILTLKSKTLTYLLGTFVPFFICHIIGYLTSTEDEIREKGEKASNDYSLLIKKPGYRIAFKLSSVIDGTVCFMLIIISILVRCAYDFSYFTILIPILLLIFFGTNFLLTKKYYKAFMNQKKIN